MWTGIIIEDGQNEQLLVRQFSTMGRVTVNANRRIVANEKGHMLFDRMERLAEEVSGLQRWKEESESKHKRWREESDKRTQKMERRER